MQEVHLFPGEGRMSRPNLAPNSQFAHCHDLLTAAAVISYGEMSRVQLPNSLHTFWMLFHACVVHCQDKRESRTSNRGGGGDGNRWHFLVARARERERKELD